MKILNLVAMVVLIVGLLTAAAIFAVSGGELRSADIEVQELIARLADPDRDVQQEAEKKLLTRGDAAESPLANALRDASPELARRIRHVLDRLNEMRGAPMAPTQGLP